MTAHGFASNDEGRLVKARLVACDTGSRVSAAFFSISIPLLQMARSAWLRNFRARLRAGIFDDDRELWTTGFLRDDCIAESSPPGYLLMMNGEAQGAVLFDGLLRQSRSTDGSHVLLIEYLATAPWNRPMGDRSGKYRGVGNSLISQAIRESVRRGASGRVGVYSFAASVPFFEKESFERCKGSVNRRGRTYCELRSVEASRSSITCESLTPRSDRD